MMPQVVIPQELNGLTAQTKRCVLIHRMTLIKNAFIDCKLDLIIQHYQCALVSLSVMIPERTE